jgi:hypothetical protein
MNEYIIRPRFEKNVSERTTYTDYDGTTFTVERYYQTVDILMKCKEEPVIDIDCVFGANMIEYLTDKYPDISPELIQQAIELDRTKAEKLVFGLKTGVITSIGPDSVEAVKDLDPFQKKQKSQQELEYDALIKQAKGINNRYWQWILPILKRQPDTVFDESIFHYLESEELNSADIKDRTIEQVTEASRLWHEEQFARQRAGGVYKISPETGPVKLVSGKYYWLPVSTEDAMVEGSKMQNCIGKIVKPDEHTYIFSMRNKFNNPHVSVSVSDGKGGYYGRYNSGVGRANKFPFIKEIKGKQNAQPIGRYIPHVLKFIDFLLNDYQIGGQPIMIDGNSDFWNLPIQFDNYASRCENLPTRILNLLSDEGINKYIYHRGLSGYNSGEAIIKRLTKPTLVHLLSNPDKVDPNARKAFFKQIIINRMVDDEQIKKFIKDGVLGASGESIAQAIFEPEAFIEGIRRRVTRITGGIESEVFYQIFNTIYKDGIEALGVTDPIFYDLILDYVSRSQHSAYNSRLFLSTLSFKLSMREAYKLIVLLSNPRTPVTDEQNRVLAIDQAMLRLTPVLMRDHSAKIKILQVLPKSHVIESEVRQAILYSSSFEELREIYAVDNRAMNDAIKLFISSIDSGLSSAEKQFLYPRVTGSAEKLMQDTEMVMKTNSVDELRNIYRSTKSRGVKIMVNRKLARMARLAAARAAGEQ